MDNNTSIWATFEDSFDIGCRVIKWDESNGKSLIPYKKYIKRDISFNELSKLMKQFTVHWSVTYRANHVYNGVKSRGLSCNFAIDDDCNENGYATIYQYLPIMYGGYSQGGSFNALGPGVEMAYMPQAWEKNMYSLWARKKYNVPSHSTTIASVHGTKLKTYLPTQAQLNSLYKLIWGFTELFPEVPAEFPKTPQGFYCTTTLSNPKEYIGLVSHYHLTRRKIDTAGLDYSVVEQQIREMKIAGY